jgi:hypothetical protein
MRVVQASQVFEASIEEVERVWYDTARWPRWVVGLAHIQSVSGGWPEVGGEVHWQSGPAGRGQVSERVSSYEPLRGQTVDVQDDSIHATQTVSFVPEDTKVAVTLSLAYELKRRSPLMRLVDLLFIRRAMARSLEQALARFGAELGAASRTDLG